MIGRVIDVRTMYKGKFTVLTIKEDETKFVTSVAIKTDEDYKDLQDKLVSINITVTPLANSNREHQYPEGTLGT